MRRFGVRARISEAVRIASAADRLGVSLSDFLRFSVRTFLKRPSRSAAAERSAGDEKLAKKSPSRRTRL